MKNIPSHLLDYFKADVLALYVSQPDRYAVHTDYFSGQIETSSEHYQRSAGQSQQTLLDVKFGFRTLLNGDLALAVWMPDLAKASLDERMKWPGFNVSKDALAPEPDPRFDMWVQRYIEGNWDVEDGVLAQIGGQVRELNALTFCTVGADLFASEAFEALCFPTAQNNHRFHDAHSEVYKFLIDGLSRPALELVAGRIGVPIRTGTEKTLKLLRQLMPVDLHDAIFLPLENISTNRRLSDHQQRPTAEPMEAFEKFNSDMVEVAKALRLIKEHLATQLRVTVESCVARKQALTIMYPKFDEELEVQANYSVCDITSTVGKTIVRVEYGFRRQVPGVQNSELVILHFDDESSMAIYGASNIGNLSSSYEGLSPEELTVSLVLNYVPPLVPRPQEAE